MYWVHLEPGFPVPLQGYGPVWKRNRSGWRTMKPDQSPMLLLGYQMAIPSPSNEEILELGELTF